MHTVQLLKNPFQSLLLKLRINKKVVLIAINHMTPVRSISFNLRNNLTYSTPTNRSNEIFDHNFFYDASVACLVSISETFFIFFAELLN